MDDKLTFRLESVVKSRQELMEDFEGPLDLILDLLKKHKIEIQDLRISLLLEQYLEWMDRQRSMDLEVTSEFAAMASYLVYMKTRMLLTAGQEEGEEIDELILALEERARQEDYQNALRVRAFLEQRVDIGRNMIVKSAENLSAEKKYTLTHPVSDIINAMRDIGVRAFRKKPPPAEVFTRLVSRESYSVKDKLSSIWRAVSGKGSALLRSVLSSASKSEAIASFLAVLELCRSRKIRVDDDVLTLGDNVNDE